MIHIQLTLLGGSPLYNLPCCLIEMIGIIFVLLFSDSSEQRQLVTSRSVCHAQIRSVVSFFGRLANCVRTFAVQSCMRLSFLAEPLQALTGLISFCRVLQQIVMRVLDELHGASLQQRVVHITNILRNARPGAYSCRAER